MKKIWFQLALSLFYWVGLNANAAVPVGASGREYAETMLLFSDKDFDIRLGAKSLHRQSSKNEPLFDMLAEMTWSACSGKRKMHPDSLAWLAKAIGNSKDGRYTQLVDDCLAKITEKAPVKYFTEAKKALAGIATSNPFVGGKLDLDKFRDDIIKNRKKTPPESLARTLFEGLKSDQSMNDVYAKLGAPEKISAINVRRGKAGFRHIQVKLSDDRIVFRYAGLGEAVFGYDATDGDWLLVNAKSSSDLYWLQGEGRFANKSEVIAKGDEPDLRRLTKALMRERNPIDSTLLDQVADRIHHSQMETDGHMADTLAHMSKLLGKSSNGKYKQFMREVSEKAAHRTLRKHAGLTADALPDPAGESYVPKKIGK